MDRVDFSKITDVYVAGEWHRVYANTFRQVTWQAGVAGFRFRRDTDGQLYDMAGPMTSVEAVRML